jgi:hypothetical protein
MAQIIRAYEGTLEEGRETAFSHGGLWNLSHVPVPRFAAL